MNAKLHVFNAQIQSFESVSTECIDLINYLSAPAYFNLKKKRLKTIQIILMGFLAKSTKNKHFLVSGINLKQVILTSLSK